MVKIYVRSGKGGDGHVSFRREENMFPNGGPDGSGVTKLPLIDFASKHEKA